MTNEDKDALQKQIVDARIAIDKLNERLDIYSNRLSKVEHGSFKCQFCNGTGVFKPL